MAERAAGVLLHPTSLPNRVLDAHAWRFLDWMQAAGLSIWQVLPLTAPHDDLSPYHSLSAFALNPRLLPPDWEALVDPEAFRRYLEQPPHWLNDYALFMVLREQFGHSPWSQWPEPYKLRNPVALAQVADSKLEQMLQLKKAQFQLQTLWQQLRRDAAGRGIRLFGDMPIFVAHDSVEVWVQPQQFRLDENLEPAVVTGVPPDYFSATGQRWGNPHYDWAAMEQDGFGWWCRRVEAALGLFDLVRIDHFRGLEASWEIDAGEPTAINGRWQKAPGERLLGRLQQVFDPLPLVAEDLGIITPEVVALKERFDLPGMSVLQFGFSGLPDNPHSPASQVENSVVYTGTHDNDTTLGWLDDLHPGTRDWMLTQVALGAGEMPWPLIVTALESVAQWAIVPMQDWLALDGSHRMNVPGTTEGNWGWQFQWEQVPDALAERIRHEVEQSNRLIQAGGEQCSRN